MWQYNPTELYHYGVLGMKWGVRKDKKIGNAKNLKQFDMKKTPTKLGNTKATTYSWSKNNKKVAEFTVFDWWDGKNIENLKVYPEYRGKGLSYDVLRYAVDTAGCKNLSVRKDNNIAKHTYDRFGFKTTEEDDEYYYMSI